VRCARLVAIGRPAFILGLVLLVLIVYAMVSRLAH
jgi:hypothetical protein